MDRAGVPARPWRLDSTTLTVRILMSLRQQGGRKRIVAPDGGAGWAPAPPRPNNTLIRALGGAHRWRRLLEEGTCATIAEIASAENITGAYVSRILQLTLLAPDPVEAILDGKADPDLTLAALTSMPMSWDEQRNAVGADCR